MPHDTLSRHPCRHCAGPVRHPRRTFCSPDCVAAWRLEHDWGLIRSLVLERDRGVCVMCQVDCVALHGVMQQYVPHGYWAERPSERVARLQELQERQAVWTAFCAAWRVSDAHRDLWEADHVVPRAEGGTNHLPNLRTLCRPCPVQVTRAWRRARSTSSLPHRP